MNDGPIFVPRGPAGTNGTNGVPIIGGYQSTSDVTGLQSTSGPVDLTGFSFTMALTNGQRVVAVRGLVSTVTSGSGTFSQRYVLTDGVTTYTSLLATGTGLAWTQTVNSTATWTLKLQYQTSNTAIVTVPTGSSFGAFAG